MAPFQPEIVPGPDTDPTVVAAMTAFVDRRLGKGVVVARDTPNFVGNRVGVFGMLDAVRAMRELDLTVEEAFKVTRPFDILVAEAVLARRRASGAV